MAREHINERELWSLLRLQSIDRLEDVQLATLEPDGKLSLMKRADRRPAERRDRTWLRRLVA